MRPPTPERAAIHPARYFRWYGWLHRPAAALLLTLTAPGILLLMALVRVTSPGPALYSQQRVGRNGRLFILYKLRSMRQDAEALSGPVWSNGQRDSRITPVGWWLRYLHLDELPQLWNVLRGDMALVGPRPERPEFTQRLGKEIAGYLDRHAVLPGITGLAQINFPPDINDDCVRRKLPSDLEYVERGGAWLDVRIMLVTAFRALGVHVWGLSRLLGLKRHGAPSESVRSADEPPRALSRPAPQADGDDELQQLFAPGGR